MCLTRKQQRKESLESGIHSLLSAKLSTNNTAYKGRWIPIRISSTPTQTRVSDTQITIYMTQIVTCDSQIVISVTQIVTYMTQIVISVTHITTCAMQNCDKTVAKTLMTMNIYSRSKRLNNIYEKEDGTMANYLPNSDHDLLSFSQVFVSYTTAKATIWGIDVVFVTALVVKVTAFQDALTVTDGPHTTVDTRHKNNTRKELETALREFVNEYIRYNHALTDEDHTALGVKIPDKHRTPAPTPTGIIEFFMKMLAVARLGVVYRDSGSPSKAKPPGVQGAEIRVGITEIGDPPITDPEKLPRSEFSTRTPYTLIFSAEDSGKRAYIAMRWENTRGEKGPWSPIQSAVIP
jgi:hypothetical protein